MVEKISAETTDDVRNVRMMRVHDTESEGDMYALMRWKRFFELIVHISLLEQ